MALQRINWGMIGCGDVTELKSGPAFNKVPNSQLVAVMRRDAIKAADYATRHGVTKWYSNAQQLINDAEVNAIYIATPPSSHLEYAIAAMQAGKHVYVEKPMANDYQSACIMADEVNAKNAKLVVAHYRRQQPRFLKIKQLLADKIIGDVLFVKVNLHKPSFTKEELNHTHIAWRLNPAIAGNGLFYDLAPHQLDLMYYFFGEAKMIKGIATNQAGTYQAADMVTGSILFKSGVVFNGNWCFNAPAALDECEIIGTKGKIAFNVFTTQSFTVTTSENTVVHNFDELLHVQQPMIEEVVNYFLGTTTNPCAAMEATEIMRWMKEMTTQ